MEPLPATDRALDEMVGERDLREMLLAMGREVVRIIPSCVGLSLALLHEGLTFTLVASDKDAGLAATLVYGAAYTAELCFSLLGYYSQEPRA